MSGKVKSLHGVYKALGRDAFLAAAKVYSNHVQKTVDATLSQMESHWYDTAKTITEADKMVSDFQKGYVIERSPYVRRRYYEGGKPGAGNRKAEPRWFDKTWNKYKEDYQGMCVTIFNKEKEK